MIDSTENNIHNHGKQETCGERQYSPFSLNNQNIKVLKLELHVY